ncbi:hypothetical protein [Bradyrhizobium sp. 2S1]|uniref:hypothetical protein n=1 Tax=Bradyrhizobium sp. 2S1 TaxID=1404429 RepID=UPI001408A78F|nr:hypothetical protein [Bradyrhizobium sp. 2S1]MCK7672642.1 hypothetical protein [Bradyrhizobium sp. 2S1]
MNIDPRNAAETPVCVHDVLPQPHRVPRELDESNAQTSSTAEPSADQASFEQQLDDLHPTHPTSDSVPTATNSATSTSSTGPNEARQTVRYPAASFVGARAQLAATLTGAPLDALRNEIELAVQQSARWSPSTAAFDGGVDRERVFDDVVGSSYVTLRRFQNQDSDCRPRVEDNTSAISHVRNTARDHSSMGDPLERYPMDRARQAGWHMRGRTASPFVSLVEDPSKLVDSRDHWARAIAQSTNALHTYAVPRSAVWTPDDVLSSIGLGMNVEDQHNIDADVDLMCALGRTPTRETERLFLGGNLDDYRTAGDPNPYKRDGND